ncbi:hypothetical protein [Microbacterium sp. 22296]|uniref:hypothetical protein n=1 Tax=Microbacterium sp. 22296 TaxID=3453903 RepID=UPI003F875D1B
MKHSVAVATAATKREKTPGTVAAVSEGVTLKEGAEMLKMIIPQTTGTRQCAYAGYLIEVSPTDSPSNVHYAEAANAQLVRFTHRIFRIPSQRRFIVRHFHDATAADRAETERTLLLTGELFHRYRHIARRTRRPDGTFHFRMVAGPMVQDPLLQLELEMMIDLSSGVQL